MISSSKFAPYGQAVSYRDSDNNEVARVPHMIEVIETYGG